jgi:hypothetical protein
LKPLRDRALKFSRVPKAEIRRKLAEPPLRPGRGHAVNPAQRRKRFSATIQRRRELTRVIMVVKLLEERQNAVELFKGVK